MTLADDPVRLEVLWQNLLSVTDEAAWTLARTAFSHAVREAWDFGVMLYDRAGHMVAQNTTVAGKNALWHPLPIEIVRRWDGRLSPGDLFVTNDPLLGDGHLYDVCVVRPLFHRGRHIGFVECVEHLSEIGGSVSATPRDRFEEGLLIPLVRLARAGSVSSDLLDMVAANVRTPEQVLGDIQAMMAATATCEASLSRLLERRGLEDIEELSSAIRTGTEEAMRSGIRQTLSPGRYENEIAVDGIDRPLIVRVAIEVGDGDVSVDMEGSSPESPNGVNCPVNFAYSWVVYAIKCLAAPWAAANAGCFEPVRLSAPEGSVVNPSETAPVRSRGVIGVQIPLAIFGAFAEALPQHVLAGCAAPTWAIRISGRDLSGRTVSELIAANGGMGARLGADGLSCTPFPNNAANVPVELIEERLPLRVLQRGLAQDSGGPGRFRGGLGQREDVEVLPGAELRVTVQTNQIHVAPRGSSGGIDGATGRLELNGQPIPGNTALQLRGGDRLSLTLPGGGGCGDPRSREHHRILEDIAEGRVSSLAARRWYGGSTRD